MAETELDKQTNLVTDLTRRVDELQSKADEAVRLKDQLDEYVSNVLNDGHGLCCCRYRHAADKLQKTENVMEKYKKKLQEGADLRQHVRVRLLLLPQILWSDIGAGVRETERRPRRQERIA